MRGWKPQRRTRQVLQERGLLLLYKMTNPNAPPRDAEVGILGQNLHIMWLNPPWAGLCPGICLVGFQLLRERLSHSASLATCHLCAPGRLWREIRCRLAGCRFPIASWNLGGTCIFYLRFKVALQKTLLRCMFVAAILLGENCGP